MINVYSPTMQQLTGVPPGTMPTFVNIMNPPASSQEGFPLQMQSTSYNYGPTPIPQATYQQQRDQAAQQLKQELRNPIIDLSAGYNTQPQYGYGSYFYQQARPSYQTVQGFNPLGVAEVPSMDYVERMTKLNNFYMDAIADSNSAYAPYQNGYNYYGYYNTYGVDPNVTSQYQTAKRELENEAKQNRIDINKRISKAAHVFLDDYDEEWADQVYDDKKVAVNNISYSQEWNEAMRFSNLVDISEYRRQQVREADAAVTRRHNKIVDPNSNLGEFLDNAGMLLWQEAFDQLEIKNRNRNRFSDHEFRSFLATQINRREPNSKNADAFTALMEAFPEVGNDFMNPPEGMSMLDDNTLSIKLPDRLKRPQDQVYEEQTATFQVRNQLENDYKQDRQYFMDAIYNGGGRRYG